MTGAANAYALAVVSAAMGQNLEVVVATYDLHEMADLAAMAAAGWGC